MFSSSPPSSPLFSSPPLPSMNGRSELPPSHNFGIPPLSPPLSDGRPRGGVFRSEVDVARRAHSDTSGGPVPFTGRNHYLTPGFLDSDSGSESQDELRPPVAHARDDSGVLDTSSAPSVPPRATSLHNGKFGSTAAPRMAASVRGFMDEPRDAPPPLPLPRAPAFLAADSYPPLPSDRGAHHLPNLPSGSTEPTAHSNWDVSHELEFTVAKVSCDGPSTFAGS